MAQYDLSRTAGCSLAADTGRDVLDFAASFHESVDMLLQICTISHCCVFLAFVRHNCTFSSTSKGREYTRIP